MRNAIFVLLVLACCFTSGCMGLNVGGGFAYNLVTGEKDPVQPDRPFTTAPEIMAFPPHFLTRPIGFILEFGFFPVMLPTGFIGGSVWGAVSIPSARRKQKARNPETPLEELEKISRDPDPEYRKQVVLNPKVPLDIILRLARDEDDEVRKYATFSLGEQYDDIDKIMPVLIENLKDPVLEVRYATIQTINTYRRFARKAVPQLIKVLSEPTAVMKSAAAEALGYMGIHAKRAMPELKKLLRSDNESVKKAALDALDRITGREVEE
ncbi:HEAT repeat domain-containing protein [Candidatus Uabimicrobium helgolandensis]